MKGNILLLLLAIAAGALGLYVGKAFKQPQALEQHIEQRSITPLQNAPEAVDFRLPVLDGAPKKLSNWRGKIIVLNFWATWCPPCRKEIPTFVRLQEKWRDNNVQFIGVSLDDEEKVKSFATEFQINYPNMLGTIDNMELSFRMGNTANVLPYTVILDQNFDIVASHAGEVSEAMLQKIIQPLQ